MPDSNTECKSFLERLDELPQLQPFPEVATRLIGVCEDPEADARDVCAVLQCDPTICLRLLRVANSSVYGYSGEIRTVDQAVVVLGFNTVRNLALSAASAEVFASGTTAAAARRSLWEHSLGCAATARVLATYTEDVSPDEAFLAAIVHDVGKLVFFDLAPVEYQSISDESDARTIVSIEEQTFGTTHQEVGRLCAEDWGLPGEIGQAIRFHHSPELAEFSDRLVSVVSAADSLTRSWSVGTSGTPIEEPSEAIARADVSVDEETLEAARLQVVNDFQAILSACEV